MALPHGRDGLSARRMAMLWTFHEPSLGRHVRRELLRNAWLDCTPIIPTTACGLDHGIGHFMLFEVDSEAQAPAPPRPKSPQTSSAASDRKSALLPSSRQAA